MSERMDNLRTWLREAMRQTEMTQRDLASATGITEKALGLLLTRNRTAHESTLRGLERALGVPPHTLDDVMNGQDVPVPTRRPPKVDPELTELRDRVTRIEERAVRQEELLAEIRQLLGRRDAT